MTAFIKAIAIVGLLYVFFSGFIFGPSGELWPGVTVLPLGAEEAVQTMSNAVHAFLIYNPFFSVLYNYLVLILLVEFMMFIWHWAKWLIEHLRG